MRIKIYTKENYHEDSRGRFIAWKAPKREPDYISYQKSFYTFKNDVLNDPYALLEDFHVEYKEWLNSDYPFKVSSEYWYDGRYLIRRSDHWGNCKECYWHAPKKGNVGKIKFTDLVQNTL